MTPSIFARHALKTRATLLTLLIFVVGLWSLTLYTSHMLREDLHKLLAEHQANMVAVLSSQLSEEMGDRAAALAQFAQSGALGGTQSGSVLQARLQANGLFQEHFNGGTFVTNAQGVSIADSRVTGTQTAASRLGIPFSDRDYVRDALAGRALVIGRPVLGRVLNAPVVGMAVPLRTPDGAVSGALAGVIDLSRSAFLDHTVRPKFSRSGSFCIVDRRYRLVVLCSDKSTSLQPLEAVGVSEQMERYLAGEEGSAVVVSADGEESLAAVRSVPRTPWLVLGLLPTSEAFGPVHALQNRMVVAALIVTLIACALTWWMLRRQLSPLLDAANRLSQISVAQTVPEPLPVEREDEVGALVGAFNRVMGQLSDHARALKESEERFRLGFENSNVGMCLVDLQGRLTRVNHQMCTMFGYLREELESMGVNDIAHPDFKQLSPAFIQQAQSGGEDHSAFEKVYLHKDGHAVYGYVSSTLLRDPGGKPLGFISHVMDISQRKLAESKLQLAASVFTHAREGIMITDAQCNIVDVNATFTDITGYARDEVLGRNPRLLSSGQHGPAFYAAMWSALNAQAHWSGEIWNRRKNGEIFPEMLTISAVRGANNVAVQYVALFSDITRRKALEEQVRQLAFLDPLTLLPNRRLLSDRLLQALAQVERSAHFGAVIFLDLDNFKPLNDQHGHEAGDLLLVEVAERLKHAVRGMDTVARIGGDEFVVVLGELDMDRQAASTQALAVAEKILVSLAEPYRLKLRQETAQAAVVEHHCTASLGLALFGPGDDNTDQILKRADTAMYEAKARGRNRVQLYQA